MSCTGEVLGGDYPENLGILILKMLHFGAFYALWNKI